MDRAQEEAIQRITAHYVDALRSGHTPKLSDYLTRYPHYANEISDFVAYFHAVENNLPAETVLLTERSPEFRIAMNVALSRIEQEQVRVNAARKKRRLGLPQQMVAEEPVAYQLNEQPPDLDEM